MFEEVIKKSRFITHLAHTPGVAKAKEFVEQIKQQHKDARHNCWAFVAGSPSDSMQLGFSDDGEPSGTAGKPILAQLQGSGIGEITAVVTRYSSGIKLGTGGLVKAYGGGVKEALLLLSSQLKTLTQRIVVKYDYAHQDQLNMLFRAHQAEDVKTHYSDRVEHHIDVPLEHLDSLKQALVSGRIIGFELAS